MVKLCPTARSAFVFLIAPLTLILAGCGSLTGVDPEFNGADTSQLSADPGPEERPTPTTNGGGGTMVVGDGGGVVTTAAQAGDEAAPLGDPSSFSRQALVPATAFTGYQILDGGALANTEVCDQTQAVIVAHPPTEFAADTITGNHVLFQMVARYASPEAAANAFTYLEGLVADCDGQFASSNVTNDSEMFVEDLEPIAVDGAEQTSGALYTLVTRDSTVFTDLYGAKIGDTLVVASSTDPDSATALLTALADRVRGVDWNGTIEPTGVLEPGPGFASPDFWALPDEGPLLVREAATNPTAGSWLGNLDDARVDSFASNACAAMYLFDGSGPVANTIAATIGPYEASSLDAAASADAFAAALAVYCPTLAEKLADAE